MNSLGKEASGLTDAQIDAALLRLDADVRQRLLIFDGGPMLMAWENAHRLHAAEPYIGCPFCHDRFAPSPTGPESEAPVQEGKERHED